MKVAILLQGDPRFCTEFDLFLQNLVGYDQVDWFMYLWKDYDPTSKTLGHANNVLTAPRWQHIDRQWALDKFKENLPSNHNIVSLELADQYNVFIPPMRENVAEETQQSNTWKMWYSLYRANQLRVNHEKEKQFEYDLVIRTRPDVSLQEQVNCAGMRDRTKDQDMVLIPNNKKCGYGVHMCDLFAIGNSKSMTTYCNIFNQALDHHARGVKFHPETMLGKHLEHNGIRYDSGGFNIEFRNHGTWIDINTGETWNGTPPNWDNKIYYSKFGRWG